MNNLKTSDIFKIPKNENNSKSSKVSKITETPKISEITKLDKTLWETVRDDKKDIEKIIRPSLSYWEDVWRRFKSNKVSVISIVFLFFLIIVAVIVPFFWPYDYESQDFALSNATPSLKHIFGNDNLGRDMFIRTAMGVRISFAVGIAASVINFIVGITFGGISGYKGGFVDNIMMRIVDILSVFPLLLYVILLMVWFDNRLPALVCVLIAIGSIYWIGMARIVRGQVLSLKEQEFVMAARVLGASNRRILFKHLIPNAMGPIIVSLTMSIPSAIFTEAFLSFVGLGVSAPKASLGSLANDALKNFQIFPHLLFFPAITLFLMILAFNFVGDGLRDALDPKMRK